MGTLSNYIPKLQFNNTNMAVQSMPPTDPPVSDRPSLPATFLYPSSTPPQLITQGAEALLFRSTYLLPDLPCALKYRPSKPYRHPILDQRLTKHRILSEARVLVKCRKEGVPVPAVYALDELKGWLMIEWIEGEVVRIRLNEWLRRRGDAGEDKLLDGEIVLIDFGLASQNSQDEDRAVDLYVLERAFGSTHPRAESLFKEVLSAYGKSFKGGSTVLK